LYLGGSFAEYLRQLRRSADSKSADLRVLGVRLPLPAPVQINEKQWFTPLDDWMALRRRKRRGFSIYFQGRVGVTEREMELALKKNDSRENGALVTLALKTLECEQKKLAKRLGVSETQVAKWKQGESMSHEKQTKLRKLIGIDMYTDFR
jgi:transcriptional regulator with XRE-family HTH domain